MRPHYDPEKLALSAEIAKQVAAFGKRNIQKIPFNRPAVAAKDQRQINDQEWRKKIEREADGRKRGGFKEGHVAHNRKVRRAD